ncbi:hypothetical protein X975_13481, partial [Stegodyphus mimosarum]
AYFKSRFSLFADGAAIFHVFPSFFPFELVPNSHSQIEVSNTAQSFSILPLYEETGWSR